jgi:hypothetical protein
VLIRKTANDANFAKPHAAWVAGKLSTSRF